MLQAGILREEAGAALPSVESENPDERIAARRLRIAAENEAKKRSVDLNGLSLSGYLELADFISLAGVSFIGSTFWLLFCLFYSQTVCFSFHWKTKDKNLAMIPRRRRKLRKKLVPVINRWNKVKK